MYEVKKDEKNQRFNQKLRNIQMRKFEILTGVAVITFLCISYHHYRTDVIAQTATETEVADLKKQIQNFFTTLETPPGSPEAYPYQSAFKLLSIVPQTQDTDIQNMAQLTEDMIKVGGGSRWRSEFLDYKSVGNDLIQFRYLYKSDTQLVVWYFTFYRSQTGTRPGDTTMYARTWNCIGVRFDNDFDTLFQHWPKSSP